MSQVEARARSDGIAVAVSPGRTSPGLATPSSASVSCSGGNAEARDARHVARRADRSGRFGLVAPGRARSRHGPATASPARSFASSAIRARSAGGREGSLHGRSCAPAVAAKVEPTRRSTRLQPRWARSGPFGAAGSSDARQRSFGRRPLEPASTKSCREQEPTRGRTDGRCVSAPALSLGRAASTGAGRFPACRAASRRRLSSPNVLACSAGVADAPGGLSEMNNGAAASIEDDCSARTSDIRAPRLERWDHDALKSSLRRGMTARGRPTS